MCDFEDWPVIYKYTNQQAIEDDVKVEILRWNGIPVTATTSIRDDFGLSKLLVIWHKFLAWKDQEEPKLPVEERLFSIVKDSKKFGLWKIVNVLLFFTLMSTSWF